MIPQEKNELLAAVRRFQGVPEPPQAPAGPTPTLDDIKPGMTAEERNRIRQHLAHVMHGYQGGNQ